MDSITKKEIANSISRYLEDELEAEVIKAFKDKKPTQDSINSKREKLKSDFEFESWLQYLQDSLESMQSQELSLATHISKGIHSAVKSDNLIVLETARTIFPSIVSSSCVPNLKLDANSNNTGGHAGHLKIIVSFLNITILDTRLYTFIKQQNKAMQSFFEQKLSIDSFDYLVNLLNQKVTQPITDGRNKQTLFPVENHYYHCIVMLYPSSLTQYAHQNINDIKFSRKSKEARKLRFSNETDNSKFIAYRDIRDLAIVKLGGENAQNVSRLNNVQGGFHYLLPSLPPTINFKNSNFKPSKFATSIFSAALANKVNPILQDIYDVVKSKKNPYTVREARQKAMNEVLNRLFEFAAYMRDELPAGWTIDYELDEVETFWLDPNRADLPEQADWQSRRNDPNNDWNKEIVRRFAGWINEILQAKFDDKRSDFADPEHYQWERDIEAMQKQYERAGKGVFL